jgi:hypothetical protein
MNAVNVYLAPPRSLKWFFLFLGSLQLIRMGYEGLHGITHWTFLYSLPLTVLFFFLSLSISRFPDSDFYLRASEDGLRIKRWLRTNRSLPWQAINTVSVSGPDILVVEQTGKRHKVRIRPLPKNSTIETKQEFCDIVTKHAEENNIVFDHDIADTADHSKR